MGREILKTGNFFAGRAGAPSPATLPRNLGRAASMALKVALRAKKRRYQKAWENFLYIMAETKYKLDTARVAAWQAGEKHAHTDRGGFI